MNYEQLIEELREEMLQLVNTKCDALLQMYQSGELRTDMKDTIRESSLITVSPAELKGKRPLAVQFAPGEWIETPTWRKVAQRILQTYNEQPDIHERFMEMCGKVAGRWRTILGSSPEEMDVPIKVDEELYFEGKFDTEAMLNMLEKKVLEPAGVDYSSIKIEERSPVIMKEYKERLEAKVAELLGDRQIDDARIATEVTIFADKICVDEETVRLRSHIKSTKDTLEAGGSVGRKLDFIAQEMNREANTILSKTNDLAISDIGISLKTDIEKVREQIQNIE